MSYPGKEVRGAGLIFDDDMGGSESNLVFEVMNLRLECREMMDRG